MRRPAVLVVAAALAAVAALVVLSPDSDDEGEPEQSVRAPTGRCPGWPRFQPHGAGPSFEGLRAEHTEETCGGSPPFENDVPLGAFVSVSYGDCDPGDEGGCTAPMEVQSRPLCDRMAQLEPGPKRRYRHRGAQVVVTGGGIDVYTGTTAVSIAGDDGARNERAVRALRPLGARPGGRLRPPDERLLRAKPVCRFRGRPVDEVEP